MNFQPLFTTSRVVVAVYRIVSTTILLAYIMRRTKDGRVFPRDRGIRPPSFGNDE